jgi:hypothetical protein
LGIAVQNRIQAIKEMDENTDEKIFYGYRSEDLD